MVDVGSLQDLIEGADLRVGSGVDEFMRHAVAAQDRRHATASSDLAEVTRSTALWAVVQVDPRIRGTLASAGFDQARWARALGLVPPPPPGTRDRAPLAPTFRAAMVRYLESGQATRTVALPDVARAILQSAVPGVQGPGGPGRLGKRLEEAGADPRVLDSALAAATSEPAGPLSASVRAVVRQLGGGSTTVSARQIAAAVQEDHPGYGSGLFEALDLRSGPSGREETRTVDTWLARVRELYDPDEVAASRHQVIDGELLLLGLAQIDEPVAQALRQRGFLDVLRAGVDVRPRGLATGQDRTDWISDDVIDSGCGDVAATDYLGRRFLAEALAVRLRSLRTRRPESFLVHLDGPWGSGKSTLFRFLKCELESDHVIVEVNAWREQWVGVQWWTLHSALRRAVIGASAHKIRTAVVVGVDAIRARLFPFLAALAVLAGIILGAALLADLDLTTSGQIADSLGKVLSLAAVGFAGLTAIYRYLLPESRRSARGFEETSGNPMEEVRRLFERTLRRAKKPVVFFIDDLDRCEQSYVVKFLEVIQTLVRAAPDRRRSRRWPARRRTENLVPTSGPYGFVAADGQWLRSSYENHYAAFQVTAVPGRPLGYLFLEKIFQLQVRLPAVTEQAKQAFYESLLHGAAAPPTPSREQRELVKSTTDAVAAAPTGQDIADAAQLAVHIEDVRARIEVLGKAAVRFSQTEIADEASHALQPFGRYLEPNPRSVKLFVNAYGMLQTLRTLEGIHVQTAPLALWTIVEIRWPLLADHLRRFPDHIDPDVDGDVPEEIADLLLDREVREVTAHLTPERVRECTGDVLAAAR